MRKQTTIVVIGSLRVKYMPNLSTTADLCLCEDDSYIVWAVPWENVSLGIGGQQRPR